MMQALLTWGQLSWQVQDTGAIQQEIDMTVRAGDRSGSSLRKLAA